MDLGLGEKDAWFTTLTLLQQTRLLIMSMSSSSAAATGLQMGIGVGRTMMRVMESGTVTVHLVVIRGGLDVMGNRGWIGAIQTVTLSCVCKR